MIHINEGVPVSGQKTERPITLDIKPLSPLHAVSPQITSEDVPAIAEAGFSVVICNRPDAEVPPSLQAAALRAAVEAAGLEFVENPVDGRAMTIQNIDTQKRHLVSENRRALAYCASGTRSAVMWALASAGTMPTHAILKATAMAGYNLDGLSAQIDALSDS